MVKVSFGSCGDSFNAGSLKAYLSEFIATLLFVFAGVGSAIAFSKFLQIIKLYFLFLCFFISLAVRVARFN